MLYFYTHHYDYNNWIISFGKIFGFCMINSLKSIQNEWFQLKINYLHELHILYRQ